jgi:hypothetical protein
VLSASGSTRLSSDSLVFTTSREKPSALSIVLQGNAFLIGGAPYGQGIRCVSGSLKRLFAKSAVSGSITAPDFGAGDPTVSARSAAKATRSRPDSRAGTPSTTAIRSCSAGALRGSTFKRDADGTGELVAVISPAPGCSRHGCPG